MLDEHARASILNIADLLHGEINRMCITHDFSELVSLQNFARMNLINLYDIVRSLRFDSDGRFIS